MTIKIGTALQASLKDGYTFRDLPYDILAGLTVGIVAIPLGLALAIACSVPPQYGLYTVIVPGFLISLFGGSRFQVSGPTAAFVALLVPVVHKFGFNGLLIAGLLSGVITLAAGLLGLGKVIQYVPHPVTTGFTSGIGVVIASIQLKDFLGLKFESSPEDFFHRIEMIIFSIPTMNWQELAIGILTLGILLLCLKYTKRFPAPILAIGGSTILCALFHQWWPEFNPATIESTFTYKIGELTGQGIPVGLPHFSWPWSWPNAPTFPMTVASIQGILPSAFAIAMLGSIESLLSAVIADGMTKKRHDPDGELIAQGIGNIVGPFFGAIPATGAIARTTTNIRFGARSPIAGMVHALVVALVVLFFSAYIGKIPMAALAGLLLFVSYNIFERKHFFNILRMARTDDKVVLLTCFFLTVFFDMVIGVGVGVVLAGLMTIRRFSELTQITKELDHESSGQTPSLPSGVFYYKIKGALFFGASQRAIDQLLTVSHDVHVVLLDLVDLQHMDLTGLVALDSTFKALIATSRKVIVVAKNKDIVDYIKRLDLIRTHESSIFLAPNINSAIEKVKLLGHGK